MQQNSLKLLVGIGSHPSSPSHSTVHTGPRPEQVAFVEKFEKAIPKYAARHIVRPGITGLAQVEQGYVDDESGTRIKLVYDLHYIENLSFKMDMEIG